MILAIKHPIMSKRFVDGRPIIFKEDGTNYYVYDPEGWEQIKEILRIVENFQKKPSLRKNFTTVACGQAPRFTLLGDIIINALKLNVRRINSIILGVDSQTEYDEDGNLVLVMNNEGVTVPKGSESCLREKHFHVRQWIKDDIDCFQGDKLVVCSGRFLRSIGCEGKSGCVWEILPYRRYGKPMGRLYADHNGRIAA